MARSRPSPSRCGRRALVSQKPGDEAEQFREGLDRGGYAYRRFDPEEAAARWPFLDAAALRYAFLSEEGGALHCRRIAADLAAWLAARGVVLRTHTEVAAVDTAQARVVTSAGETIEADRVVVAAGAWVLRLFPDLAGTLALFRQALAYVTPPADLAAAWAKAPVLLDIGGDADGYAIPPSGGGGLKFGSGRHKVPADDPDADRTPRPGEGETIRRWFSPPIARIEDYAIADVVTCAYTFTADKRFFLSPRGRTLVVSACSGHGYKFGAAVGRRVAEAAETGDVEGLERWLKAELPAQA